MSRGSVPIGARVTGPAAVQRSSRERDAVSEGEGHAGGMHWETGGGSDERGLNSICVGHGRVRTGHSISENYGLCYPHLPVVILESRPVCRREGLLFSTEWSHVDFSRCGRY